MTVKASIKPTAEQIEQRYKDNDPNDEWYAVQDADVARMNGLLEKYKTSEALMGYGTGRCIAWGKSTTTLKKEIAACIVALRQKYKSTKGNFPDWDGRTGPCKAAKRKMYRDSGLSEQDVLAIDNSVKYHVQNLVVKVAPKKELEAVGMLTTSRRERQSDRQQPADVDGQEPTTDMPEPVVVAGIEILPPAPKSNDAENGLEAARNILNGVLKSKDLMKADKDKVADYLEEIQTTTLEIGEALSEAAEKTNKRKQQAADRRAAAADAA